MFYLLLALVFVQFTACAQPKQLTILHFNDVHASIIPHEAAWIQASPKPMVGGFKELNFALDSIRATRTTSITLDDGDDMTGYPISDIEYKNALGGGIFEMMNLMGVEAWTFGNHDLDLGQANLGALMKVAKYPTVCANVVDSSNAYVQSAKPYTIIEKNGLRIGIIGVMTPRLFEVTNTKNLKGLKVLPAAETVQRFVDSLNDRTDLVIALSHMGVDEDSVLAAQTTGLDVIVGGHSHTRIKSPKYINGVVIVQAGGNCENLGLLDLEIENNKVVKYQGQLVQLWKHAELPPTELSKTLDELNTEIEKEYGVVMGTLNEDWKRSNSETAIGYYVADAFRQSGAADIGITNSSGIRKDLLQGKITKLDLYMIGPFLNYICTFPISGKDLRMLIQKHVDGYARNRARLQYAGVQCTYSVADTIGVIQSLKVNDVDIDDAKTYTIATTDFVIDQANDYFGFVPEGIKCSETSMRDALYNKILKEKEFKKPQPQFVKTN